MTMSEQKEQFGLPVISREGWGDGPWDEDDIYVFDHAGLPCRIVRNRMGSLCGQLQHLMYERDRLRGRYRS